MKVITRAESPLILASAIANKAVKMNTMNWIYYFIDIYLII
jgi:hypothetical protein